MVGQYTRSDGSVRGKQVPALPGDAAVFYNAIIA